MYRYYIGGCSISDLFDKGEPILGEASAEPNIGSPLLNKSNIGQAADQATILLFSPGILVLYFNSSNEVFQKLNWSTMHNWEKVVLIHLRFEGVWL